MTMPNRPPLHRAPGVETYLDRAVIRSRDRSPSRIYGRQWQALRRAYLVLHPVCECADQCGGASTVVDHVKPHNGDRALLMDWDNLQAMTKPCHDAKTAGRDGGFGNPRRPQGSNST